MIITKLTAQLGVILQKRPELWMSYPQTPRHAAAVAVSIYPGEEQTLRDTLHKMTFNDGVSEGISVGDMVLHNITREVRVVDDLVGLAVDIGTEQILRDTKHTLDVVGDGASVSVGIGGSQVLHTVVITGTELSSANISASISVGDTQILSDEV